MTNLARVRTHDGQFVEHYGVTTTSISEGGILGVAYTRDGVECNKCYNATAWQTVTVYEGQGDENG